MIYINICENRFTILNIYAPNQDDPKCITTCLSELEEQQNDDRVMVGDFNCIVDNTLDKKGGGLTHSNKNMQELMKAYLEENGIIYIWRKQHPQQNSYTYHCKRGNEYIFARLDYFLVSFGLSNLVKKIWKMPIHIDGSLAY